MYYIKLKEKVGIVGCQAETEFDCLLQPLLLFLLQAQCSGVSRMVGQKGKRNLLGKGPSTPEFLRGRMGHCLTDLSVWVPLQAHFDRRFRFNER